MANNIGTLVTSPVRPFSGADTFPTSYANENLGGFKTCQSISERNSIPVERLTVGTLVYVFDTDLIYYWDGTTFDLGKKLTNNNYTDSDKATVTNLSSSTYLDKHFLDDSFCVSRWESEVYAHQGFCFIPKAGVNSGKYIYTYYLANDGTYDANGNLLLGSGEGENGQVLRMSKVGLLNNNDRTFWDIAKQNTTYTLILPDGTIDPNNETVFFQDFRPQGQVCWMLNDGYTIRLYGNALIYGKHTYFFRDFDTRTDTLGNVVLVRVWTKHFTEWKYFTIDEIYGHYDWWAGGMPANGITYPENALGATIKDFLIGGIDKMFNGSLYTVLNVGSGADNRIASVLARSLDQGVNWYCETGFNPLALAGTTGVHTKALWEGIVRENTTSYCVFLRGAGASSGSPASGLYRADVPKNNLKIYTLQKVLNESNEKVCMFSTYSKNFMINPETNKYFGSLNSNRTVEGVYQLSTDFTTITRLFGFSDANGCHTWDVCDTWKDTCYGVYSSSRLRKFQKRGTVDYYANTTEVWAKRLKADLFY